MPAAPIPVTVLTGFLGAGKTTLLNRILTGQHGRRIAVIENEFGEVGVDNQLVIQSDEEIFEMNNGCLCCTVRGDLIRILGRLMKRKDRLDAVLIETTGLANPAPVAQTFFSDPEMREQFRLDGVVTLVDARHVLQHLDDAPEVRKQIAFADVLLLNKTDLVPPAELDALEARLRPMNAMARVVRTSHADVPVDRVVGIGGFNLDRALEVDPRFLETEYPFEWAGAYDLAAGTYELVIGHCDHDHDGHECACEHDDDRGHGETDSAVGRGLPTPPNQPPAEHPVAGSGDPALQKAAEEHDAHEGHEHCDHDHNELDVVLLPVPASAAPDHANAIEVAVGLFSDWEKIVLPGETIDPGTTLLRLKLQDGHAHFPVKIATTGRYLLFTGHDVPTHLHDARDELIRYGWDRTFRHEHTHEEDVASVGITTPGDLDGTRLNKWISELLQKKGADIYRMKGVLAVRGTKKRLVFQGVHMFFDAKFDREWRDDEPRTNTLVFIGKNLDRTALTEGFKACLAG
jgi:G3E family GTPase